MDGVLEPAAPNDYVEIQKRKERMRTSPWSDENDKDNNTSERPGAGAGPVWSEPRDETWPKKLWRATPRRWRPRGAAWGAVEVASRTCRRG